MNLNDRYMEVIAGIPKDRDLTVMISFLEWLEATHPVIPVKTLCVLLADMLVATISGSTEDTSQAEGVAAIYSLYVMSSVKHTEEPLQ
jgi:hypothetical protein